MNHIVRNVVLLIVLVHELDIDVLAQILDLLTQIVDVGLELHGRPLARPPRRRLGLIRIARREELFQKLIARRRPRLIHIPLLDLVVRYFGCRLDWGEPHAAVVRAAAGFQLV